MTREEAIKFLKLMRKAVSNFEEYGHDKASMVIECDKEEALDMAIEALHREEAEANGYCHRIKPKELQSRPSIDLISRADAIKAVAEHFSFDDGCSNIYKDIDYYKGIAEHILKNVPSADAVHIETYRELYEKYVDLKHASAEADRPSGEWTYLHGSIGSYMTISCPFCGKTFNDVAEWEYNYCPSCGARMKGGAE